MVGNKLFSARCGYKNVAVRDAFGANVTVFGFSSIGDCWLLLGSKKLTTYFNNKTDSFLALGC